MGSGSYKPGSVLFRVATIPLGLILQSGSSDAPERKSRLLVLRSYWSCSRWGLPCRRVLPLPRCAFTTPFHPYRVCRASAAKEECGGLFSVALSRRGVLVVEGAARRVLPGTVVSWSPDFPRRVGAAVARYLSLLYYRVSTSLCKRILGKRILGKRILGKSINWARLEP